MPESWEDALALLHQIDQRLDRVEFRLCQIEDRLTEQAAQAIATAHAFERQPTLWQRLLGR